MIHWMTLSILAAGIFYAMYMLLFRKDKHLQLHRWYLIVLLAFSLVYPLVQLPKKMLPPELHTAALWEFTMLPESNPDPLPPTPSTSASPNIGMEWVIPTGYVGGVAVSLLVMLVPFGYAVARTRRMPFEKRNNVKFTLLDDETEPYSFFNHIIIGTRAMSDEELRLVLAHEREHVRQRHTLDVLLMRFMCCMAWFNPFAWLMLRELRAVHEYQADAAVLTTFSGHTPSPLRGTPPNLGGELDSHPNSSPKLGEVDAEGGRRSVYLHLLFKQTTGFGYGHITNNFNSINLKKRITMMNKTKSRFGAWKALAALPVAALLMMVGCQNTPLTGDTLYTKKYNIPDGSYLVSDGHVSYVDVFKDGRLISRHLDGLVEIPLDKIGEMDILNETNSLATVDKAAEKHKEYKYVRVIRLKNMAEPPEVMTDYYELCYSNDSTCQVARETEGESVSTLPTYIGGEEAMYKYIAENLRYPEQAKADGIAGRVQVSFVIEKDGSVTDVEVVRGIGHGCDEEAVRVVKSMPRWTPGTLFGKPVRVHYNMPFAFKLQ